METPQTQETGESPDSLPPLALGAQKGHEHASFLQAQSQKPNNKVNNIPIQSQYSFFENFVTNQYVWFRIAILTIALILFGVATLYGIGQVFIQYFHALLYINISYTQHKNTHTKKKICV